VKQGIIIFFLTILLGFLIKAAFAEPILMSDKELDEVSGQGVELKFKLGEGGGVDFEFDLGPTVGNGSVVPSSLTDPSNAIFNGTADLSGSQFIVDNLIFNLNICIQCQADIINQIGFGAGFTFTDPTE
jgi:hypothetical protein